MLPVAELPATALSLPMCLYTGMRNSLRHSSSSIIPTFHLAQGSVEPKIAEMQTSKAAKGQLPPWNFELNESNASTQTPWAGASFAEVYST